MFGTPGGRASRSRARVDGPNNGAILIRRTGGVPIQGTNTNDNAAVGYVGEIIESTVLQGAAVVATTGVSGNITSISLTAGDWDVWGLISTVPSAGSVASEFLGWISSTSATIPTRPNGGAFCEIQWTTPANANVTLPTGTRRFSLSATTTVYLGYRVSMTTAGQSLFGYIGARRVR